MPRTVTKLLECRGDVVCLDNHTRWRVARYNAAAIEGWRAFDQIEIGGLRAAPVLTNIRRAQTVRASLMEPGEEG